MQHDGPVGIPDADLQPGIAQFVAASLYSDRGVVPVRNRVLCFGIEALQLQLLTER